MALEKPYQDIPGTTVFDADQARIGYHLNMFCMSLMKPEHRAAFKADQRAYLDRWPMSEQQKQAVLARDYNRMIALGGNIYFLAKIFATDGKSFQYAAALMTGMSQEAYAAMMLGGGRAPESQALPTIPTPARSIAGVPVGPLGLGCMNLSHAYGTPPPAPQAAALLRRAIELGVTHFDTAALYGFGSNESLLGEVLAPYRRQIFLASKCGMTGVDGRRVLDGRPETLRSTCMQSLARLRTDHIDLYYLHRWDRSVPIEDSVGALAQLVSAGHIGAIGLSEVSAATLRRAHAVHPIAALQNEYSLWTRNPEAGVLEECRRLGVALVAFSPLGRGFLAGAVTDPSTLVPKDLRREMPRFAEPNFSANARLLEPYRALARQVGCSPAQLALAWLLHQAPHLIAIPGTTSISHLEENLGAANVVLPAEVLVRLQQLIHPGSVLGARYNAAAQADIDTEELALSPAPAP